jgi:hypothetical protein
MEYAFATPEFKATDYPTEWVVAGWAKYFQWCHHSIIVK